MRKKIELWPSTMVFTAAIVFFISSVISQQFIGLRTVNWLEAFGGAVLFAIIALAISQVKPERRVVAVVILAVAFLIIMLCTQVTGITNLLG
jgi:uncharacterized membrane protein